MTGLLKALTGKGSDKGEPGVLIVRIRYKEYVHGREEVSETSHDVATNPYVAVATAALRIGHTRGIIAVRVRRADVWLDDPPLDPGLPHAVLIGEEG